MQKPAARFGPFLVAAAGVLAFGAYLNALGGEFVYDDRFQILRNPTLGDLANLPRLFAQSVWQFMSTDAGKPLGLYYRPLFNAALLLEYQAFGTGTLGWHLVSVGLHVLNTVLVYALGRAWGYPAAAAGIGAALFAVHPVHVESVAWISGLPDPLAAAGLLGAAIVYERGCRAGRPMAWLVACALLAAALLSKEVAAAFPIFVLAREWMDREPGLARPRWRAWRRAAPFAAIVGVHLGVRYAVLGVVTAADVSNRAVTATQVLLTLPSVLTTDLRLLAAPYPLSAAYDVQFVTHPVAARILLPLGLVMVVAAASGALIAIAPIASLAVLWLGIFLWPALDLRAFNSHESIVHDRYLYVPSAGFCLLLGLGIAALWQRGGVWRRVAGAGGLALGGLWLALTVVQSHVWRDDLTLAAHVLRWQPTSAFFQSFRGAAFAERGDLAAAEDSYHAALRLRPNYGDAYSNLGDVQLRAGRWGEAVDSYRNALATGAASATTYLNLGFAMAQLGDVVGAEAAYRAALSRQPNQVEARVRLANLLERQGREAEAIALRQGLRTPRE